MQVKACRRLGGDRSAEWFIWVDLGETARRDAFHVSYGVQSVFRDRGRKGMEAGEAVLGVAAVTRPQESGHLYGYGRVSTTAQDLSIQEAALRAAGCTVVSV